MKYTKLEDNIQVQHMTRPSFPQNISFIMKLIINKNKIKI